MTTDFPPRRAANFHQFRSRSCDRLRSPNWRCSHVFAGWEPRVNVPIDYVGIGAVQAIPAPRQ
jgi:hypothetical protein